MFFTVTVLVIGILLLLYYFLRLPFNYWKNKNVPYPPVSYLFGNIGDVLLLKNSPGQVFHKLYEAYPNFPFIGLYKTRTPCILIRDPELVKEVLVKSFNSFRDNALEIDPINDPLFAKNAFAAKGQLWREIRSQSTPSFTAKRVKEMFPIMDSVAKHLIEHINTKVVGNPEGADIKELALMYTTDVVTNCALGLEGNSFVNPNSDYIKMIKSILSPSLLNNITFLLTFNFPSLAKIVKVKVIPNKAAVYYQNVVRKTLEYRKTNNVQRGDFLDSMNEVQNKMGSDVFRNDNITAHVMSFFTDGTETSAIVLSFTLYELALHSDVQAYLKSEIDEIKERHDGKLCYDAIQEMKYLDQVINENLRKNTPVPFMTKMCTDQINFESPYKKGERVSIEPGTPIIISIQSLHHDPKYHPDPETYDPARFAEDNIEKQTKYTFFPFGEGPRICLGQRFGIGEVKVALVQIIDNFEIRVNKTTTVPYKIHPHYFMLAAKDGIKLDFYKRHSTNSDMEK